MIYKVFEDTVVLRLEKGEEILSVIKKVCETENITLGSISALGAVDHVVVGLYKVSEQKYYANTFDGEMEIASLVGNITTKEGEIYLHIHATFADQEGKVWGGHLNEARISATCEIFIQKVKGTVGRAFDNSIGLNVMTM